MPAQSPQTDYCDHLAAFARHAMELRQMGVPVEVVFKEATTPGEQALVLQAFLRPVYFTRGFRQQEIDNLSTNAFIDCRRANLGE